MINDNGERALAHIEVISAIDPIEGADKIEVATILGWKVVIAKKDNFKVGDKVVYIEVDSKVSDKDERFAFLADRKYRIKTVKLRGQYSQGLAMPITQFPEIENCDVGTDVTKELNICYYIPSDNERKAKAINQDVKYSRMSQRHKELFKKPLFRWLMRRQWGKDLLFVFFGKKKDKPLQFPTHFEFVHKTDEERVENMPWILNNKDPWVRTCKVDGTSATYILERKHFGKYEFYVTSRNVRQLSTNQKNFHNDFGAEGNVYWEMAFKYNIEEKLKAFLEKHKDMKYVCLQGEIAGPNIQKNPHGLKEVQFFGFNFIDSDMGRWDTITAANYCHEIDIPWVPVVNIDYILPDTMEEMKLSADGPCDILGSTGMREGFVYRSVDGKQSFKNVSRKYLLKYEGD